MFPMFFLSSFAVISTFINVLSKYILWSLKNPTYMTNPMWLLHITSHFEKNESDCVTVDLFVLRNGQLGHLLSQPCLIQLIQEKNLFL